MNITDHQEHMLNANGWSVVRQQPLHIEHTDGSRATGMAALFALPAILASFGEQKASIEEELQALITRLLAVGDAAASEARATQADVHSEVWRTAYGLCFNDAGSLRVCALCDKLVIPFDWNDPDGDYQDDVMALMDGLRELRKTLAPFTGLITG